ncbi:winged helix-turn-helix transcriptional regulator [Acrocarpospora catenulata]|uniref:winged helix-turn-helix transcriptional regulator n=1 Tax=Acrocarpospora catenulata TaxID=2836182 RepID=UPI001BDA8067|nr:helix-turn-helix domain-containing protein [Acrocarpospora catenulata]
MTLQMTGRLAAEDRTELGDLCPIERASELVARRSTVLLLREASYGTARFDDFVRRTGLTESVTAAQLRTLVTEGLMVKQPYREPAQRQRFEYVLTEAGHDFVPILLALASWGDRHRPRPHRLRMVHAGCGAAVEVEVRCANGHVVGDDDVTVALRSRQRAATD